MKANLADAVRHSVIVTYYFVRFFLRHFQQLRGMQTASSLAYTTLLSLVPLITVMFGLFGRIPVLQDVSASIQQFVFSNFVPQFGETVQTYIGNFSDKASQLTITGSMVLVIIAVMLMATIDNAFNRIWFVTNKRGPVSRLLVYWAVLTMGPLLIGIGLASTSYLLSLPVLADVDKTFQIKATLLSWLPFLTTSIAFSLLYILIPNCFVPKRHAIFGGVICAVLFEFAKYGFGIYVRAMPTYENIYGAISVIPLFLIWIYVSWIIVLFGAHISFCLSSFRLPDEIENRSKGGWDFINVLKVLQALYEAQQSGKTLTITHLRKKTIQLPHYQLNDMLEHLQRANWVNQSSSGQWLLSKDMTETRLLDIHHILPVRLPVLQTEFNRGALAMKLKNLLGDRFEPIAQQLQISIAEFFKSESDDSRNYL